MALVEQGDTFELQVDLPRTGDAPARLVHLHGDAAEELDSRVLPLPAGDWIPVRFANIDNHLLFDLDQADFTIERTYEANRDHPAPFVRDGQSIGHRVGFGGEGARARFRSIRVSRDLFYTETGTHGVGAPLTLGPYEYFLLGDNSAHSTDSRGLGPFKASQIIGQPYAVVWPLAQARRLHGALLRQNSR